MTEHETRPTKGGIKGDHGRQDRLARELRANLARRKDRQRKLGRAGQPAGLDPESTDEPNN